MQFSGLVTEVFRRVDESESAPVYWTEDDVKQAINEGYQEISDATEWYETTEALGLLQDICYYDINLLFASVPPLRVTGAYNNQTGRWLVPTTVNLLDHKLATWQEVGGEPEWFFVRGLWYLGLWPIPDASAGTVTVYYTSLPAELSLEADTPGFPQEFHFGLVEYAIYELLSQDAETKESLRHYAKYLAYEQSLKLWVQERSIDRIKGYMNG